MEVGHGGGPEKARKDRGSSTEQVLHTPNRLPLWVNQRLKSAAESFVPRKHKSVARIFTRDSKLCFYGGKIPASRIGGRKERAQFL